MVDLIRPHLRDGDTVLDVGCGAGTLGAALHSAARAHGINIRVEGLERFPRGGEPIGVTGYEGGRFPLADQIFDVVIVADVLHHELQPDALLGEYIRVSKRHDVIKDHQLRGPSAQARVSLIDWAAKAPYGVKCLFRYNRPQEWDAILRGLGLSTESVYRAINLYPAGFNLLFGRRLQYLAVCRVPMV